MKYKKLVVMLLTITAVLFAAGCSKETTNQPASGTPAADSTATVAPTITSTPTPTPNYVEWFEE